MVSSRRQWQRPERQLGDLGGDLAVADAQRVARLRLAADERERDRAVDGGHHGGADASDLLLAAAEHRAGRGRSGEAQAAEVTVRLAAVEQARDRLMPDVAALGERDR